MEYLNTTPPMGPTTPATTPTPEQQDVIDSACSSKHLVVQAGAGTGKTSTLTMVAQARRIPTLYLAYNKATALDAASRFGPHVTCKTSHSLAYAAVGRKYSRRLNSARQPSWEVAKTMGLGWLNLSEGKRVSANHLARITADTVRRFCYSADVTITGTHVPFQNGITGHNHTRLIEKVLPLAQRYWEDVSSTRGTLPFEHDHYLKIWALSRPTLNTEVVMLDEAQDSNPVLAEIVANQTHAQQIVVGDGCQQMYGWRGAVDALEQFAAAGATQLYLSQSWRFGEAIADEANKWLAQLPTRLHLSGNPGIDSTLGELKTPHAVLCRTNAGAMNVVLDNLDKDVAVALVGGGVALSKLAKAAEDLIAGRRTTHPELHAFPNWASVQDYAQNDSLGSDLAPLVKLIDAHGTERILEATNALSSEDTADLVVSTAHKAKGREWDTVGIAEDYFVPAEGQTEVPVTEAMVGYVAVTRARHQLDRRGLAWIDDCAPAPAAAER
jgi:AAA domain-containing protein/UvrD-like helicase family protein